MFKRTCQCLPAFVLLVLFAGGAVAADKTPIRLATTTSTENSGLLEYLLPDFEKSSGYKVHVIAVGTGKAIRMAADGDVDVILVHAPPAEMKFMGTGAGTDRRPVMHNDFVIVGPPGDPAGIRGLQDAATALQRIAAAKAPFVSRGDDSGTDKKEKALWKDAAIKPSGQWYREAGQGMGKVLQMASEMGAYTLTDRGTWLAYQARTDLNILTEGDQRLFNPYHIIAVNPAKYPDTNFKGAEALTDWITGEHAQVRIADFRKQNQQLFHPDALQMVKKASASVAK
jgi:tungstate transport system substrate-binding protein